MVRERLTSVMVTMVVLALIVTSCSSVIDEAADGDGSDPSLSTTTTAARSDASVSTTGSSTTTTTAATTTTTRPEPEAETDPAVLAEFVSEHNGDFRLDGANPTVINRAVGEEKAGFPASFFVDPSAWAVFTVLGLIDPDADPEAVGQHRIETIRGMCCPVAMWDNDDHPLLRSVVLVHELTHLADSRRQHSDDLDEELFATLEREQVPLLAVATEGNASRVHELYREELEVNGARPERFVVDWGGPEVPEVMVRVWQFAYVDGQRFMQALVDRAGVAAVDGVFDRPPVSSEQVYDVDAYLNQEVPVDVPAPEAPPGADVVNSRATLGSFLIQVLAEQSLTPAEARTLAISWAGDAATIYELEGQRCIAATLVMDDEAAAADLVTALNAATVDAALVESSPESDADSDSESGSGWAPSVGVAVDVSRCVSLADDRG